MIIYIIASSYIILPEYYMVANIPHGTTILVLFGPKRNLDFICTNVFNHLYIFIFFISLSSLFSLFLFMFFLFFTFFVLHFLLVVLYFLSIYRRNIKLKGAELTLAISSLSCLCLLESELFLTATSSKYTRSLCAHF